MAEKLYKVGEPIPLRYQAPNKQSGLSGVNAPVAEILLDNAPVSGYDPVELIEVGASGNYVGSFTPDQEGEWSALMHKADGDGQVPKAYSVGGHNVHSVGEAVGTVDGKVGGVQTKLDAVEDKVDIVNANVDEAETNIRGTDSDTLKTLSDQLDDVDDKVSSLDTPPVAY